MTLETNSGAKKTNGSGWQPEGGGWFSGRGLEDATPTKDFQKFAEDSRKRWDFVEFIKAKLAKEK